MVSVCRGKPEQLERMPYVAACLDFLASAEQFHSRQPFRGDLASVSGRHSYTQEHLQCDGPIFLYHTYWNGPINWRLELFIKGFLRTQNLDCSQLWLWVDGNHSPKAFVDLLTHPRVRQFLPLLANDTIVFKTWTIPQRIALPSGIDHKDGKGFCNQTPERLGHVQMIGDKVYEDKSGQVWLDFFIHQGIPSSPVTLSDIFRFTTLHQHGGVYLDMDVLLLRDLRPLLMPQQAFAERWGAHGGLGDYNTAVLYLESNSSLSSYFLRIGARLGHSFHPRILGDIARKDGRHTELLMLETAVFDPVWTEFDGARRGPCTTPCFRKFQDFFDMPKDNSSSSYEASEFFAGAYAYHIHNLVSTMYFSWAMLTRTVGYATNYIVLATFDDAVP
jgi:hypothetical protein